MPENPSPSMDQPELQPKNSSIDIRDLLTEEGREKHAVLASETLQIQGQKVTIRLSPFAPSIDYEDIDYEQLGYDDYEDDIPVAEARSGLRVMIASYISTDQGERMLQHIPGPLVYESAPYIDPDTKHTAPDPEWQHEQRTLSALAQDSDGNGHLATSMPHAETSQELQFVTTAPGIRLDQAVDDISFARSQDWLNDSEALLMLYGLYQAAQESLHAFHAKRLIHGHMLLRNLMVKLRAPSNDGLPRVTLFDYTLSRPVTDNNDLLFTSEQEHFDLDTKEFVDSWQAIVKSHPPLAHLQFSPAIEFREVDAANELANLGVISTLVELHKIGIETATELDARAVLAAQDRLIASSEMPDIAYPTTPKP
jgi:hypothetical protein